MRNESRGNSLKSLCAAAMLLALPAVLPAQTAAPTQKQVMLSMAYAANLSGSLTGESAEVSLKMAPLLDCFLHTADTVKDQWTVVWGPEVVTKQHKPAAFCKLPEPPDKVPANTMFVAKMQGENTYVIAIAGTNRKSAYAWCEEDFDIVPIHWPASEAAWNADATIGTLKGLKELQGMSDPGRQNAGLQNFLKTVTGEPATLYVTGHSLGGALAPALAQWLADTRSTWDPKGNANLQIFAFAGATPGNRVFADYVNATFPGEVSSPAAAQPFAMVIVNNTLDVVPHAWNVLSQVPNLYQAAGILPNPDEMKAINFFRDEVDFFRLLGYHYASLGNATQQQSITGQLLTKAELNPYTNAQQCLPLYFAQSEIKNDFAKQALYQHLCAYPNQLDLPNLWTQFLTCASPSSLKTLPSTGVPSSR